MGRRPYRVLLVLLGVCIAGAVAYLAATMRPLAVAVATPVEMLPVQVFGLGTVEARILSEIGFEVGGALVALEADHGDRVQQGAVLARLNDAEQQARLAKAAAGTRSAEAMVKRAEAAVARARAVLAQRRQANERRQALRARQTVSAEAADEAQMAADVAAAELAVAISEVEVAAAALTDGQAQQALEQVLFEQHALKAPYDGLVVRRHKELGAVLGAGESLFTLVAPETVWALAFVDESRAGDIREGQPADVRLRSRPRETFQGHVARIDIESDRVSEERRVHIVCDRCPERFHLGEQAEVFITTGVLERAVLVPETSVDGFDGVAGTVWTVEDGELHRRRASFGRQTLDSRLEIVDGLSDGAQVVTTLRAGLREGRAATPRTAAAP